MVAAPQAISFSAPATGKVGQSITLSASGGGSGNPVVFSVPASSASTSATNGPNGATLQFTAAGICVVDADQAGTTSFAAAPTVSASIVVEQAPAFTAGTPPTTGTAGQPYAYAFAASGSPVPTFALAPGAPVWLTLDVGSGGLSGTPPAGTTSFTYSVTATNDAGTATAGPFAVAVGTAPDPGPPVLAVALSCPAEVAAGADGSCTLTVQNTGTGTAASVSAAVVLPFRLRLASAPGSFRWFGHAGAWSVGSLAPGATATFSVTFHTLVPGWAVVVAGACSAGPDPAHAADFTSATVLVTGDGAADGDGAGHGRVAHRR